MVDGNSIINRAFFALYGRAPLTAPDGTPTGAVNGFFNSVLGVVKEYEPDKMCVLFDLKAPTFRHKMSSEYKANRKGMPEELALQMPVLKELLDLMGIARMELEGYEADDLIGTLSLMAEKEGDEVFIFSGDHDDYQLISDKTSVIMPQSGKNKEPRLLVDRNYFENTYGVKPEVFVQVKALMGDNSDNIKGVDKIGEKTAFKLISEFGSIENILNNTDKLSKGQKEKLDNAHELLELNIKLCTIVRDVPVPFGLDKTIYSETAPDPEALKTRLDSLELRSLIKKLGLENVKSNTETKVNTDDELLISIAEKVALLQQDKIKPVITSELSVVKAAYDSQTEKELSVNIDFCGDYVLVTFKDPISSYLIPLGSAVSVLSALGDDLLPVAFEYKDGSKILSSALPNVDKVFDTAIAGFVLNEIDGTKADFERLFKRVTGLNADIGDSISANVQISMDFMLDQEKHYSDLAFRSVLNLYLASVLNRSIKEKGLTGLLYDIEFPLIITLDQMERNGMYVSRETLDALHQEYTLKLGEIEQRIYTFCGKEFNISSPKQLSEILFGEDNLNLPAGKKNKNGVYSTGIEELNRLRYKSPVIDDIIRYRELSKLDSTYAQGLVKSIEKDGRIRTRFTQAMTNTGRLSSTEPNLQNIPVRTEEGARIRAAFKAPSGKVLVDSDYSQIELRLLASMSGDEYMCRAFNDGEDIHKRTAMKIFNVDEAGVTSKMRATAKTVNFSIIYGVSDYGLSNDLGVSFKEASEIIKEYEAQFPGVMDFLNGLKKSGEEKGYVDTLFGRRRYLTELKSPNRNLRNFGFRVAMNTPIQGTAADIMKIALNKVYRSLKERFPEALLVMTVHDELIIECDEKDAGPVSDLLKSEMDSAVKLKVPLLSEVNSGKDWLEAK
ncbi:MAG: DNA polymerase I [Clostridiales bacterium]|nr:DNA polymerase I [Clostridiales bacterium]